MIKIENLATSETEMMVCANITAPLYWWKNFDFSYYPGKSASFLSIQELQKKEFSLDDFSHEHSGEITATCDIELTGEKYEQLKEERNIDSTIVLSNMKPIDVLQIIVDALNTYRGIYLMTGCKSWWWQIVQTIPSSYNYTRTVTLTYDILADIYKNYRIHFMDEWKDFCSWIETLPNSDIIMIAAGLDENSINARLGLARHR